MRYCALYVKQEHISVLFHYNLNVSVFHRTRADPRGIIEYRDLDAPEDIDMI